MMLNDVEIMVQFGYECEVAPRMRLTCGISPMCTELTKFFHGIIGHMTVITLKQTGTITGAEVAKALDILGVQSASGRVVSPSHVSNCVNNTILRVGPSYSKDKYKGFNHWYFNSKPMPPKNRFAS